MGNDAGEFGAQDERRFGVAAIVLVLPLEVEEVYVRDCNMSGPDEERRFPGFRGQWLRDG